MPSRQKQKRKRSKRRGVKKVKGLSVKRKFANAIGKLRRMKPKRNRHDLLSTRHKKVLKKHKKVLKKLVVEKTCKP
jgi:hypothetical protein